ncbi:hypothetical protein K3555_08960 [Leisingera sp. M527]|uniref:hypothetical protein n=1 Tax=Leisingera sp. M527 TaxID=2867014 RepID=UPI0021A5759D|nr:hypothetical protein [Leisingera sp. M527]UWQ34594.1 hypothetical protein K3555_08960 [Leisingera sp. M527]
MNKKLLIAQDVWGSGIPDWITVLATECDRASQNQVSKRLQISATAVSQVISRTYSASLENIEKRVREVYMNAPVNCPALAQEISSETCLSWRLKSGAKTGSDPFSINMDRACRRCTVHQGD